jgi:hypothetical protein
MPIPTLPVDAVMQQAYWLTNERPVDPIDSGWFAAVPESKTGRSNRRPTLPTRAGKALIASFAVMGHTEAVASPRRERPRPATKPELPMPQPP